MKYWDVYLNGKLVCAEVFADDKNQALTFAEQEQKYVKAFLGYIENGESVITDVKASR